MSEGNFSIVLEKFIPKIDALISTTVDDQKKLVQTVTSDDDFKAIFPTAKKLQLRLDTLTTIRTVIQEMINAIATKGILNEIVP